MLDSLFRNALLGNLWLAVLSYVFVELESSGSSPAPPALFSSLDVLSTHLATAAAP
jgi:hypothetical protein